MTYKTARVLGDVLIFSNGTSGIKGAFSIADITIYRELIQIFEQPNNSFIVKAQGILQYDLYYYIKAPAGS